MLSSEDDIYSEYMIISVCAIFAPRSKFLWWINDIWNSFGTCMQLFLRNWKSDIRSIAVKFKLHEISFEVTSRGLISLYANRTIEQNLLLNAQHNQCYSIAKFSVYYNDNSTMSTGD